MYTPFYVTVRAGATHRLTVITCASHKFKWASVYPDLWLHTGKGKAEPQAGFAMWILDRSWMPTAFQDGTVPTTALQSVTPPHRVPTVTADPPRASDRLNNKSCAYWNQQRQNQGFDPGSWSSVGDEGSRFENPTEKEAGKWKMLEGDLGSARHQESWTVCSIR